MTADRQPELTRLGELATVKARLGWKGLKADEYVPLGCYFLATPNIKGSRIDFDAASFIPQWRYDESPEIQLRIGDVLLVKDGSTLGTANLVRDLPGPTTVNGSIAVVRANPLLDSSYLFQYVRGAAFQDLIRLKKSGLGVPHLFQADLREFRLFLPELPEQRQIAGVLDTIDDAIRKTEQIIAKLKQVKQGLLRDLLTCGVDDNGELRDPERHPEQFKDSPLGQIPRAWHAAPFRSYSSAERPYLKTGPFGSSLKQHHWVSKGIPVITIGALGEGEFILTELLHVSEKTARTLGSYAVSSGDIVFSRVADVGRSVVVEQPQSGWIMSSNLMWISLDRLRASPAYVQANISANPLVRAQIRRFVNSAGRDVANAAVLNAILLPWPSFEEQRQVAAIRTDLDERLGREQAELEKLVVIKRGLMEDLLTGRVRVTKLLESAAE